MHATNPSQETLGQAGAIYKGNWRLSGQRRDLERSLFYYQRGAAGNLEGDYGYTRINAAFVLDLLAKQEVQEVISEFKQEEHDSSSAAQIRREQATCLREEIAAELPGIAALPENAWLKKEWWYGATMAEALFGLKRYSEARHWLREAIALDPPAWQLETTTRQMAMLAFAQDVNASEDTEPWQTLAMLVGDSREALRAIAAGKVGLALSGGGFRASLFHIGVLARLAELDVLRHVDPPKELRSPPTACPRPFRRCWRACAPIWIRSPSRGLYPHAQRLPDGEDRVQKQFGELSSGGDLPRTVAISGH